MRHIHIIKQTIAINLTTYEKYSSSSEYFFVLLNSKGIAKPGAIMLLKRESKFGFVKKIVKWLEFGIGCQRFFTI